MADQDDKDADKAATPKAETGKPEPSSKPEDDEDLDDADEGEGDEADEDEADEPAPPPAKAEAKAKVADKPKADDKPKAKSDDKKSDDKSSYKARDKAKAAGFSKDKDAPGAKSATAKEPASKKDTGYVPPKAVHLGGESFVDRVLPHIKKIIWVAIGVAIIMTFVFAFKWWRERRQAKSTQGMAMVLEIASRPVRPPGMPADPKIPSFESAKERAQAVLTSIDTEGVDMGHAYMGGLRLDAGELDQAIAEYEECRVEDTLEGVMCREGLGIALETKALDEKQPEAKQAGLEKALEVFKTMQPDETGPRYVYALYHQGRVTMKMQKTAEGKALLEKALALAASTDLEPLIQKRLEGTL